MLKTEIRRGAYYDSIILMQLQRGLAGMDDVSTAGVVMGTPANKDILEQSALLTPEANTANPDDLIIVVDGTTAAAAEAAIAAIDQLLTRRRAENAGDEYRPRSMEAALKTMPKARWVLVSVPGRYAKGVADEALHFGRNVFLYSDNVGLDDEIDLKLQAAQIGLLVMGPDCGTAIVNGVGLGFANAVRRGNIGVVGASGTGLQHVTARIHQLGAGITQALGTGGRDLSDDVGAITARQCLDLLSRDPATEVIVLISKPPSPRIAAELLRLARATAKPTVVNFIGYTPDASMVGPPDRLSFTHTLDATAVEAVRLSSLIADQLQPEVAIDSPGYLRALYSGGTLAYEAQLLLREYLPAVYSNAPLDKQYKLDKAAVSQGHTVVDLGEDEFTLGRLHPMMDNELRSQRLRQEIADPETAMVLFDLVLGYGAHVNPAKELAEAVIMATRNDNTRRSAPDIIAVVVGTDIDPQPMDEQIAFLRDAGIEIFLNHEEAVRSVGERLRLRNRPSALPAVNLAAIHDPLAAVNVGLESFADSLAAQGATVIQLDWRPPTGGNEKLAGILARMKRS